MGTQEEATELVEKAYIGFRDLVGPKHDRTLVCKGSFGLSLTKTQNRKAEGFAIALEAIKELENKNESQEILHHMKHNLAFGRSDSFFGARKLHFC